jgi:negative regulator of flagellin synthesis FlgM
MHVYGPSQLHGPQSITSPHGARQAQPAQQPISPDIADEVNISSAARMLEQVQQMPEMRQQRIDAVRAEIAAGTYETPERLNIAIERLLDEIG